MIRNILQKKHFQLKIIDRWTTNLLYITTDECFAIWAIVIDVLQTMAFTTHTQQWPGTAKMRREENRHM